MVKTWFTSMMLIKAVRNKDWSEIRSLAESGADLNETDSLGNTPLHEAVLADQQDVAAFLLFHGADYRHRNAGGEAPFDESFVTSDRLHGIRQRYQRLKLPATDVHPSPGVLDYVDQLEKNGIARVPGLVTSGQIETLKADFARFIDEVDRELASGGGVYAHYDMEMGYRPKQKFYVTNNAFRFSDELVLVAGSDFLCGVARGYLGRRPHLRRAQAMRYEPTPLPFLRRKLKNVQFRWHHDMDDRLMKVMIILTDITERDQYMNYVKGSHNLFHPYERFFHNRLDKKYVRKAMGHRHLDIERTIGAAGDAFFFDTNGMHAARRSGGRMRDAFFLGYTTKPDNHWGADISDHLKEEIARRDWSDVGGNPFEIMLSVPRKWTVESNLKRTQTSWVLNLYRPETWVWSV